LEDPDFTVSAVVSELATGAQITFGAIARRMASNTYYMTEVLLGTDQSVQVRVRKVVGGAFTTLQTSPFIPGLTHAPTTRFRLRFNVIGATVRAKVWDDSDPEPPGWHVSATDTDIVGAGTFGCRSVLLSGNTNTLPVLVDYDDFTALGFTGGLTVPFTIPAQVSAGRATLVNAGTSDVGLRLRIDGPVVEPRVTLLTDQGTAVLRLNLTVGAGQWLDIDTAARTVYLNGVASRRGQASV